MYGIRELFILQNLRSSSKNVDELQILLFSLEERPVVISLTETRLKKNQNGKIFTIEGYYSNKTSCSRRKSEGEVGV